MAAYDDDGGVVLFGGGYGERGSSFRNDTWVWDGTNWTQKSSANNPTPRIGSAMAYDETRGQVVLFGGDDSGGGITFRNDTWVWSAGTTSCTATSIAVDTTLSNKVLTASISPQLPCSDAILTIGNAKAYWTNFTITSGGSVSISPIGGDHNLYARFRLLPPGTSVDYAVHFSRANAYITVFASPTVDAGTAAPGMNVVQAILNVLPLGSVPVLVIDDYQKITTAIDQMPHFAVAVSALFSNPPKVATFSAEFAHFLVSNELQRFVQLVLDLELNVGIEVIKDGLKAPGTVFNALKFAFGNLRTAFFQYPAGSVSIVAH